MRRENNCPSILCSRVCVICVSERARMCIYSILSAALLFVFGCGSVSVWTAFHSYRMLYAKTTRGMKKKKKQTFSISVRILIIFLRFHGQTMRNISETDRQRDKNVLIWFFFTVFSHNNNNEISVRFLDTEWKRIIQTKLKVRDNITTKRNVTDKYICVHFIW